MCRKINFATKQGHTIAFSDKEFGMFSVNTSANDMTFLGYNKSGAAIHEDI